MNVLKFNLIWIINLTIRGILTAIILLVILRKEIHYFGTMTFFQMDFIVASIF